MTDKAKPNSKVNTPSQERVVLPEDLSDDGPEFAATMEGEEAALGMDPTMSQEEGVLKSEEKYNEEQEEKE